MAANNSKKHHVVLALIATLSGIVKADSPDSVKIFDVTYDTATTSDLRVFRGGLAGTIPTEVGCLTALTTLDLEENLLTGPIPWEVGALTKLTKLDLDSNQLSGSLPSEVGLLTALTALTIHENQLSGGIPSEVGLLTDLITLDLNSNKFSSNIPAEVGSMTSLKNLYLNKNMLSNNIPEQLGSLGNMSRLYLYDNQLSGSVPSNLCSNSDLYEIRVDCAPDAFPVECSCSECRCDQDLSSSANQEVSSSPRVDNSATTFTFFGLLAAWML